MPTQAVTIKTTIGGTGVHLTIGDESSRRDPLLNEFVVQPIMGDDYDRLLADLISAVINGEIGFLDENVQDESVLVHATSKQMRDISLT